ncbi:MAG: sel1 repeat family protein [Rhodospirillales bacterium]|nr:sel1 repeat family protein [Rhodospirillales bacterium]
MRVLATVCVVGLALGALAAGAAAARTPPGFDGFDCVMRVSRAGPMLETCYAAARGDAAGAHKFGRALMQGDGMTRDLPMAVALLRRAAEAGLPAAALDLARAHQRGLGVPRDVEEAARWFRRAATDDYPRGKFELAVFLDGTRIADGEVVDLMRQAYRAARAKVAGEDVDALYVVGAIQTNDEYAPPYQFNPEDGMKLLRRAAMSKRRRGWVWRWWRPGAATRARPRIRCRGSARPPPAASRSRV